MKSLSTLDQLAQAIPPQTYSITGKPMEPTNIVLIGSLAEIKNWLEAHGWFEAARLSFISATRAALAAVFNLSYRTGPVSPSYIKRRRFFIAFERPTKSDTFRRRHHVRLWRTRLVFKDQRVWAGTISYDRASGVDTSGIIPTHHISPNLLWEEKFLAESLGIKKPTFIKVGSPRQARLSNGDFYEFDGRALIINLSPQK